MSVKEKYTELLNRRRYLFVIILLIIIAFITMIYSFYLGNSMTRVYTPLIDAAMEIKLETTTAHLWFEEILTGDRHEEIETVWLHIEQADWYAKAMLEGGKNSEGTFIQLDIPALQKDIIEVRRKIDEFKIITRERYAQMSEAAAGTDIDERYDVVFRDLITQTDQVEISLQKTITDKLSYLNIIQIVLILIVLLLIFFVGGILYRYEKHLREYNSFINKSDKNLETEITERKQVEEELKKQNYLLEKTEEIGKTGSWKLDMITKKLQWTDQAYKIFSNTKDSILTFEFFLNSIHPDDKDYVNKKWLAALEGKPYNVEHRILIGEKVKWVIEKAELKFNENKKAISAIGFVRDITERKQIEEELKKHYENLEEMVKERTSELEDKNKELEKFSELFINREFRIKELRDEIKELKK